MAADEKRYQRLLTLHEKRKQIEQARLARLEAAAQHLSEEEKRLIEYFSADSFSGLFPDLVMGRIRANRQEQTETKTLIERQAAAAREQARRVRQAEVMLDKAKERRERDVATATLRDILERVGATKKVSAR